MGILKVLVQGCQVPKTAHTVLNMEHSSAAADLINGELTRQGLPYKWLERTTGYPYKAILRELKHHSNKLSLELTIASADALGIKANLVELMDDRLQAQPPAPINLFPQSERARARRSGTR